MEMYALAARADMKDVGEAMFVVLVVVLTFIVTLLWAGYNRKKRNRKGK